MKIQFLFVPFPQEIWRDALDLSEAEFKLLGYLLYHQAKFGVGIIALSDDEMLNGRRRNGARADKGCGVKGRNNLKAAREKLKNRGWIECESDHRGTTYKICLCEIIERVSETDTPLSDSDSKGVRNRQEGCPKRTVETSETDTPNKEVENLYRTNTKPSAHDVRGEGEKKIDERFPKFVDVLYRYHGRCVTEAILPFANWFGKRGGQQLKNLLKADDKLNEETFYKCVVNRARSPGVQHHQPVYEWLGRILDFAKPKENGNGRQISKADSVEQRIIQRAVRSATASANGATSGQGPDAMEIPGNGGIGIPGLERNPKPVPD